jgi:hypothetical protein
MVTFHRSQHVLTMDIPEEFARSATRFADQLSHTLSDPSKSIPINTITSISYICVEQPSGGSRRRQTRMMKLPRSHLARGGKKKCCKGEVSKLRRAWTIGHASAVQPRLRDLRCQLLVKPVHQLVQASDSESGLIGNSRAASLRPGR